MAEHVDERGEQPRRPTTSERFLNWARDFIVSTIVLLAVAWLFERITSNEAMSAGIDAAIRSQNALTGAVARLSPLHLFRYFLDTDSFIASLLQNAPSWIGILAYPLKIVVALFSLLVLPIAVFVEGNPFEWLLILAVYVPSFFWLRTRAKNNTDALPGQSLLYAFVLTIATYWFLDVLFVGALKLFGHIIVLARLAMGGSIAISTLYWAVGKRGEHSLTERILAQIIRTRES